jgi:hypothetical protein
MENKKYKGFRGGDGAQAPQTVAPYDPTTNPGYLKATELLAKLKPGFDKANHKMTPEEIMATMPAQQAALILAQQNPQGPSQGANWGNVNNRALGPSQGSFQPVQAPQWQGGLFNGPSQVDPSTLRTPAEKFTYIASLLGKPNGGQ